MYVNDGMVVRSTRRRCGRRTSYQKHKTIAPCYGVELTSAPYYNDVTFNLIQFQILCFVFALRRNIKIIIIIKEEEKKKNI